MLTALLPLVGLVSIVKARRRRKSGASKQVDEDFEKRKAATLEAERRMKAYLESRDSHKE